MLEGPASRVSLAAIRSLGIARRIGLRIHDCEADLCQFARKESGGLLKGSRRNDPTDRRGNAPSPASCDRCTGWKRELVRKAGGEGARLAPMHASRRFRRAWVVDRGARTAGSTTAQREDHSQANQPPSRHATLLFLPVCHQTPETVPDSQISTGLSPEIGH